MNQSNRAGGVAVRLFLYIFVVWAALLLAQSLGGGLADILANLTAALDNPFDIHWTEHSLMCILICSAAYAAALCYLSANQGKTRDGAEHGSATWGTPRQVNAMFAQKQNKLLTQNVRLGLDTHKHRRSLNVLVIGGSGAGKSRSFVKPNILEANTNYVITDPKSEVLLSTGGYLKSQGYDIRVLNLVNLAESDGYNPFRYIRDEKDALRLVNNLIQATTPKNSHENDPFWTKSETALLQAIILMLWQEAPEYEQNFSMVMRVLEYADTKEDDDEYVSPLDLLFQAIEREKPDSVAVRQYKVFKLATGKTARSILVSAAVRLAPFNLPQIQAITDRDDMDLYTLGERKCALYAVIPDNDNSLNFLVSLLYAQAFQALYYSADQIHHGALPCHVHFVLDEFAAMPLPGFTRELATMRSRNISASTIIQNMSQIKELYKDSWETIPGNSDTILYLGGNESSTHEYISKALGKSTINTKTHGQSKGRSGSYSTNFQTSGRELLTPDEVRALDNRYAILFIRGAKPVMDLKYDLMKHPAIGYTVDGGGPPYIHHQDKPKTWLPGKPLFVPEAEQKRRKPNMNHLKYNKLQRRAKRLYVLLLCLTLTMAVMVAPAAAAAASPSPSPTTTDPLAIVSNLSNFIFSLIRAVGLILLGYGILQVGLSLQSHDPSQRSNGMLTVAGGIVITFTKEILNLITGGI